MEIWFTEKGIMGTMHINTSYRVKKILHSEQTPYQRIDVIETFELGKMLILDDIVQTTVEDEFIYHEMITHVPLFTHKNPKKVLIIGGGDGGVIKEILKHPYIEKIVLVEIDERVIEVSKQYLSEISYGFSSPKVEVVINDGSKYIKEHKNEFDIIIVDTSDPKPDSPALGLFTEDFFKSIYEALKEDGLFVQQTESLLFDTDIVRKIYKYVSSTFPIAKIYVAPVPTYTPGPWALTMGSKKYDPTEVDVSKIPAIETKYFVPEMLKASFVLPKFIQDMLKEI